MQHLALENASSPPREIMIFIRIGISNTSRQQFGNGQWTQIPCRGWTRDWLGKLLPWPVPEAKVSFSSRLDVVFGFWWFRVSCRSFSSSLNCLSQTKALYLEYILRLTWGFYQTSASAPWHHICANHVFDSARQKLNMASRTKHAFDIL